MYTPRYTWYVLSVHALRIASERVSVNISVLNHHLQALYTTSNKNYAKAVASCFSLTIFKLELGQEVTLVVTQDSILRLILGVTQQCG